MGFYLPQRRRMRGRPKGMETKKEVMERLEKLAHHLVMSLEGMVRGEEEWV